jgi:hypothetical protein
MDEKWHAQGFKKVVIVNLSLLSLAVITILASALIKSWILQNADIYSQIVAQSMGV